jgi:UDP-glucose 4-epimerase
MVPVTGGAGFIGSHLVDALLTAGQEPVVLDNIAGGDLKNLPNGVKLVKMFMADAEVEVMVELKPEVVIHAAAQVSVADSMQDPQLDLAVNVQGTANVLEGAKVAGARRVSSSSPRVGVYGESDDADEATLPRPRSYYSAHKYLLERYAELSELS